jgi:hypothetical protein
MSIGCCWPGWASHYPGHYPQKDSPQVCLQEKANHTVRDPGAIRTGPEKTQAQRDADLLNMSCPHECSKAIGTTELLYAQAQVRSIHELLAQLTV